MNLAQYQEKFGELPAEELVSLATVNSLAPETAKTLVDGMEILVGFLGTLAGKDGRDDPVH